MPPVSRSRSSSPQRQQPRSSTWSGLALNLGIWLALWALLSGNDGWVFGVPVALLAVWASHQVRLQVGPLQLRYLPAFLGFFLTELVIGGWDVARRAWHPQLPIAPRWLRFDMSSEEPRVQLLLSALVGLLPGTFASHYAQQTLYIHALDHRQNWRSTVQRLEHHLDRLLREPPA